MGGPFLGAISGGLFGSPGGGTPGAGNFGGLVSQTGGASGGFPGSAGGIPPGIPGGSGVGTTFGQPVIGPGGFGESSFTSVIPPGGASAPGVNEPSFLESLAGAGTAGSNFNVGQSFVDPAQQPFLDFLRTGAAGVLGEQAPAIGEFAFPFADELLSGGRDLLTSLGTGAFADPLRDFTLDDSLIEGQISALGTDINTELQRFLGGAGGLGSEFAVGGTLGGGRQQVQEGIATQGAIDIFARESAALRGADVAQRQRLGLDQATSLSDFLGRGQQAALGGLQDLFNLGVSPFNAAFAPFQNFAEILGDPTVVREEFGQGTTAAGGQNPFDIGGTASLIEVLNELFK